MTVRRNAFGRQVDSFEADLDFTGIDGDPVRAVFNPRAVGRAVGPGVDVLPGCRKAPPPTTRGRAAGPGPHATSFHPEVTGDRRVHQLFVDMVRGN